MISTLGLIQAGSVWAADPVRVPNTVIAAPSGADVVNRMLSPGPSDPSVPMPRADLPELAQRTPTRTTSMYGRVETGGGLIGFTVPLAPEPGKTAAAPGAAVPPTPVPVVPIAPVVQMR